MDLKLLNKEKGKNRASFLIKKVEPAFVNSLRRIMISEVSTMAIEEVEFKKNGSALYDEIVAHRLGLIPLTTDLKSYILPNECKCEGEGCAQCQLKLILKVKGPGVVYASDLKSKDPKIKPVFPKMVIALLLKGQDMEFEATATLGIGKEHMKWSSCLAHYKNVPIVTIKKNDFANAESVSNACPVDVFDFKDGKLSINKDNENKCHMCEACTDLAPKEVEVSHDKNEFIFTIESWGGLSPRDIAKQAAEILKEKSADFIVQLKSI